MDGDEAFRSIAPPASSHVRVVCVGWGVSAALVLGGALGLLLVSLGSRTAGRPTIVFSVLAVAYAAVIGLCLASATWRRRLCAVTSKLLFLTASSLFGLVVIEFALRVLSPPSPFHPSLAQHPNYRRTFRVDLPGVSAMGTFSTNKWGLRGDDPPTRWRDYYTIVTIGGSTTHCIALDDHKTWSYRLQEELKKGHPKTWVGNGGLDGHSTRGHLIFMREAITKIKPDAVMLLVGINDLTLSLNEKSRERGNGFDFGSEVRLAQPTDPIRALFRVARDHMRLLQLASVWRQVLNNEVSVIELRGHDAFTAVPLDGPAPPLPVDLNGVLPQLSEFRANVKRIIEIGRSHHIRVIFLTQPLRYDDTEYYRHLAPVYYWMKTVDPLTRRGGGWSAAQHWHLLEEYNKNLRELCRAENVECFDLAHAVPHSAEYFYDTAHFTEAGAELVAREIASFLEHSGQALDKTARTVQGPTD